MLYSSNYLCQVSLFEENVAYPAIDHITRLIDQYVVIYTIYTAELPSLICPLYLNRNELKALKPVSVCVKPKGSKYGVTCDCTVAICFPTFISRLRKRGPNSLGSPRSVVVSKKEWPKTSEASSTNRAITHIEVGTFIEINVRKWQQHFEWSVKERLKPWLLFRVSLCCHESVDR